MIQGLSQQQQQQQQQQSHPPLQRKRSYSTTAYPTPADDDAAHPVPSSACMLAASAGTRLSTYEFVSTLSPPSQHASSQPPVPQPGELKGSLISNEQTLTGLCSLKWGPDNSTIVTEAFDGRIFVCDRQGRLQRTLVDKAVPEPSKAGTTRCVLSWAAKPQRLYFANGSKALAWDMGTLNPTEMFETSSRINSLAINADDALLAAGQNDGTLLVFSRLLRKATKLDTSPSLIIGKLEYSYFNRSILGGTGNDGVLRLWETSTSGTGSSYHSFPSSHESTISAMSFSPSNRYLICTAGLDRRYVLYDVEKKGIVKTTSTNHALTSASFKSDGISMAFGTDQGEILLYDLRSTNRPITTIDTGSRSPIMALHFQGKYNSLKRQQSGQAAGHGNGGNNSNSSSNSGAGHHPLKRQNSSGTKHLSLEPEGPSAKPLGLGRPTSIRTVLQGMSDSTSTTPKETRSAVEPKTGGLLASLHPQRSASTTEKATGPKKSSTFNFTSTLQKQDPPSTKPSQAGAAAAAATNSAGSRRAATALPSTPVRDPSTYSRLSVVSPSFQNMQPHPPSAESTPSNSSINTPPRSPVDTQDGTALATSKASDLQHQTPSRSTITDDYPSAAPHTPTRHASKRRKSFGALMASGGANSDFDAIPDEKMEVLRSQIVDKVRGVVLGQDTQTTGAEKGGNASQSPALQLPGKEDHPSGQRRASSSNPFHDIWLRAAGAGKDGYIRSSVDQGNGSTLKGISRTTGANTALAKQPSHASTIDSSLSARLAATTTALDAAATTTITHSSTAAVGRSGGLGDDFQVKILENVIQDCLTDFRQEIRRDIQNMHLELLRQFQIQKMDTEALMRQYSDTSDLWQLIEQLQEENRQLRSRITRV